MLEFNLAGLMLQVVREETMSESGNNTAEKSHSQSTAKSQSSQNNDSASTGKGHPSGPRRSKGGNNSVMSRLIKVEKAVGRQAKQYANLETTLLETSKDNTELIQNLLEFLENPGEYDLLIDGEKVESPINITNLENDMSEVNEDNKMEKIERKPMSPRAKFWGSVATAAVVGATGGVVTTKYIENKKQKKLAMDTE